MNDSNNASKTINLEEQENKILDKMTTNNIIT